METLIRPERAEDVDAIAGVVAAAFGSPVNAQMVADIRASDAFIPGLSLVADVDGVVVGHVMVSYVALYDGSARHRICCLSPLAVAPPHQRRGIGSALVRDVVSRVDALGEPFVVLEGSPVYYGRLGFESSIACGVRIHLPDWAPPEAAQIYRLRNYDPAIRGLVVYPKAVLDAIAADTLLHGDQ
jgi:putative acetyltransferase